MITLACRTCGTRHQVTVFADAEARGKNAVEAEIAATATKACVNCGNETFHDPHLEKTAPADPPPALLVGPGIPELGAQRAEQNLFIGTSAGIGFEAAVALSGDLALQVGAPRPSLEEAVEKEGWEIFLLGAGDPSPITASRPGSGASFSTIRSAAPELARLGLDGIVPHVDTTYEDPRTEALARALGYVVALAVGYAPVSHVEDLEPRYLGDAKKIAFLSGGRLGEPVRSLHAFRGDYKELEGHLTIEIGNGILDTEEHVLENLQTISDLAEQYDLYASAGVVDALKRVSTLLYEATAVRIEIPDLKSAGDLRYRTAKARIEAGEIEDKARHEFDDWRLQRYYGEPLAEVRAWRAAAGDAIARPVIFLDIDGALLPLRALACGENIAALERLREQRRAGAVDMSGFPRAFDRVAIDLMNRLARLADAQFVISSNWLMNLPYDYSDESVRANAIEALKQILIDNGLDGDRFHADFTVPKWKGEKRHEIGRWLGEHPEVHNWVTVEDDCWDDDRCVRCTYEDGMTLEVYQKACRALGIEDVELGASLKRLRKRKKFDHFALFF